MKVYKLVVQYTPTDPKLIARGSSGTFYIAANDFDSAKKAGATLSNKVSKEYKSTVEVVSCEFLLKLDTIAN